MDGDRHDAPSAAGVTDLKRTLGARDIAIITAGTIVGSGIFLTPGLVLASSGLVGVALLVWTVGGILALLGTLTYAELGCLRTGTGGLYIYLRDGFGSATAFVFGWTLFVVIASGTVASGSVATADNLAVLVPLGPAARKVVALTVIAGLALLSVRSTRQSTTVLTVGTIIKVGALVVLIVALPLVGKGFSQVDHFFPERLDWSMLSGALTGMISVLWAYDGWQYATFMGGEVREVQRNFPRGLITGTLAALVVYVLVNAGYVAGLGPERLAVSTTVGSDAVGAMFGPVAAKLLAVAVLVSIITGTHAILLTSSRVLYAMARDGAFFQRLSRVHSRFGTPANSIVSIAVWAAALALSGRFNTLLTYVVFVSWIFYALGALAVIALRRKEPHAARPFKVPGYPATPIIFAAAAGVVVLNVVVTTPIRGAVGIGGTLLGFPVYYIWKARRRREVSSTGA